MRRYIQAPDTPRSVKAFCLIMGLITASAIVIGVRTLNSPASQSTLVGGTLLAIAGFQAAILIGLWVLNKHAWRVALIFYTAALALNMYAQSLIGLVLDTAILGVLLAVQGAYFDDEDDEDLTEWEELE